MWSLIKIRIKRLYSHLDTEFKIPHLKLTQFIGKNHDDPGTESNGAGKSTILDGINLLLLAETWRDTGKDEFIMDGEESCEVEGELFNPHLVRSIYIKRQFFRGDKSSTGSLLIDNERVKNLTNVNQVTKRILSEIGISKEDLQNYFLIGQGNHNSFFTSGDTVQKEIISRFSNFNIVDQVYNKINEQKDEVDSEMQKLQGEAVLLDGRIQGFEEQYTKIKEKFDIDLQTKSEQSFNRINSLIKQFNGDLKRYKDTKEHCEKLKNDIRAIPLPDTESILHHKGITHQLTKLREMLRTLNKEMAHLQLHLDGAIQCPNCAFVFLVGGELTLDQAKKEMKVKTEVWEHLTAEINGKENDLEELANKIEDQKERDRKRKSLLTELEERNQTLPSLKNFMSKTKQSLETARLDHKTLLEMNSSDMLSELSKNISNEKQSLDILDNKITELKAESDRLNFYSVHFGKAGFKTFLSNKTIKNIEDLTNFYLNKFDTNLNVKINGYKVLKDGSIREKIDVFIIRNGLEAGKFDKFSGGEKSKIEICSLIALQKLINNSCSSGGLNLLTLDEYIMNLDDIGQYEASKLLSQSDTTVLLIMHHTKYLGGGVVQVEKINGISQITKQQ